MENCHWSCQPQQGCTLSLFSFNFTKNILSETLSSDFLWVELLPGDLLADLKYTDGIIMFGQNAYKI